MCSVCAVGDAYGAVDDQGEARGDEGGPAVWAARARDFGGASEARQSAPFSHSRSHRSLAFCGAFQACYECI